MTDEDKATMTAQCQRQLDNYRAMLAARIANRAALEKSAATMTRLIKGAQQFAYRLGLDVK